MDGVGGPADKVIRFLVSHAHCSECGGHYRSEDVYVLERGDDGVWDLAAVCHQCYTLSLVRAVVRPHRRTVAAAVSSSRVADDVTDEAVRSLTELTAAERRHFAEMAPIGIEDVLDVCHFLESFDGDFRALFGREPDEP